MKLYYTKYIIMVYIKKTDNRIMNNTGQLNEPQLKVFNKVLNKLLSQKFPWWFEGIEISRAGMNDNQTFFLRDYFGSTYLIKIKTNRQLLK